MKDTGAWLAVGGLAAAGAYLWWRQPAAGGGETWDPLADLEAALWGLPSARQPVSGPGPYTQAGPARQPAPAPVVQLPPAPSWTSFGGRTAVGAGTAVGIAAIGPGTVAVAAATAGIGAGVAALYYAIAVKGLFRGGEEALHVNPVRDKYLAMFGPPGTGEGSGFFNLAASLFEITHDHSYFDDLKGADTVNELVAATFAIQEVYRTVGITVPAYSK